MPRNRPPPPKGRSRELLFNAETSVTSTDESDDRKPRSKRPKSEKVEAPSAELVARVNRDWGKVSVYITLALAAAATIYNYADLVSLARNTADDVKDLKRRSDDLIKSSIEASARLGVLERRETAPLQTPAPRSLPKPASR